MAEEKKPEKKQEEKKQSKSAKGLSHYLRKAWKKPDTKRLRELMIEWRKGNKITKLDRPTRLDRARALGYKAKKGFVIARVIIERGGRKRTRVNKKRGTKRQSVKKVLKMNYRWIAEQRAQKKFKNLEILNSYPLAKDGKNYFFEVILVDKDKPEIKNDKKLKWIVDRKNKKRAQRGLTSAAKKSRGLRSKSRNLKVRPSLRAWNRKGK